MRIRPVWDTCQNFFFKGLSLRFFHSWIIIFLTYCNKWKIKGFHEPWGHQFWYLCCFAAAWENKTHQLLFSDPATGCRFDYNQQMQFNMNFSTGDAALVISCTAITKTTLSCFLHAYSCSHTCTSTCEHTHAHTPYHYSISTYNRITITKPSFGFPSSHIYTLYSSLSLIPVPNPRMMSIATLPALHNEIDVHHK